MTTPLARGLGIADCTVRRCTAGDTRPVQGVLAEVLRLARERAAVLAELAGSGEASTLPHRAGTP